MTAVFDRSEVEIGLSFRSTSDLGT